MTEQEKLEFLFKALEENGWKIEKSSYETVGVLYVGKKKDVRIAIWHFFMPEERSFHVLIKGLELFPQLSKCEVFSDHIEFKYAGCDVMVRFSDAYFLMEYNQEKEIEE